MQNLEEFILVNRMDDLQNLEDHQIFNFVTSFDRLGVQSELLYLLEPHILKHVRGMKPNFIAQTINAYMKLG